MERDQIHDLTPAYALDALDEHEREAFEAHLARCERCRDELGVLQDAAAALAYAVDGPPLPPALRERMLEKARAERTNVVSLRPRWAIPAAATAALAAAACVAVLGWNFSLSDSLDRERAVAEASSRALAVLAQPGANWVSLDGQPGMVAVTPSGEAAVVFASLPEVPAGKTLEAWVIRAGEARPAGTFSGRAFVLTRSVPAEATVAFTLEPEGGSDQPTSDPFATARVS